MNVKTSLLLCLFFSLTASGISAAQDKRPQQAKSVSFFQVIQEKLQSWFVPKYVRERKQLLACAGLTGLPQNDKKKFQQESLSLRNRRDWLVLVDPQHVLPADYQPADMTAELKPGWPKKAQLRGEAMQQLLVMIEAAQKDGVRLVPISTYRTWQYQDGLYRRNLAQNGGKPSGYVARAGESQHHLGTAVDFNTVSPKDENIPALVWLRRHAGEYGFSLSFPKGTEAETESGYPYEAWHYRYITREAVQLRDDFFGGDQHKTLKFLHNCVFDTQSDK